MNMGQECSADDSREVIPCNPKPCGTERFCQWSAWSDYSSCSAECGPGTMMRTRDLELSLDASADGALDSSILAALGHPVEDTSAPLQNLLSGTAGFAAVLVAATIVGRFQSTRVTPSAPRE
jgi:hypothetical protein